MYWLVVVFSFLNAFVLLLISCEDYERKGLRAGLKCLRKEFEKTPKVLGIVFLFFFVGILTFSTLLYLMLNGFGKSVLLALMVLVPLYLSLRYYKRGTLKFWVEITPQGIVRGNLPFKDLERLVSFLRGKGLWEEFFSPRETFRAEVYCKGFLCFLKEVKFFRVLYGQKRKVVCVDLTRKDSSCESYKELERFLRSL